MIVGLSGSTFIPFTHEYIDDFYRQCLAKILFISVNVIINCVLTAPPSEIYAFRTFTLYATVFHNYTCLVEVSKDEIDFYYRWLKNKYALDFVKQLIYLNEEHGIRIDTNISDRITLDNLNKFIEVIK